MDGVQGDRLSFYYPRLQAMAAAEETAHSVGTVEIAQVGLAASFRALPTVDGNDGETVLCYRSYLPARGRRCTDLRGRGEGRSRSTHGEHGSKESGRGRPRNSRRGRGPGCGRGRPRNSRRGRRRYGADGGVRETAGGGAGTTGAAVRGKGGRVQVTIDFGDGAGARDYSALVLEAGGVEVVRKLNKPSELKLKLLVGSVGAVAAPPVGADVEVVRSSAEKLFTGAVAQTLYQYLGWGEQGGVYALEVIAFSSEANSTSAAVPGTLPETGGITAAKVLQAQAAGLALGVADDNGITEGIELPVVEYGPETSAAEVIAGVAGQARLSYRVHDGQLVIAPVGAVQHVTTTAGANGPQVMGVATASVANSKLKTGVTAVGRSEAQEYVVEYLGMDGTASGVAPGRPLYDATSRKLFLDIFANGTTALAVTGQTSAVGVTSGQMSVHATAACEVAVGAPVECGGRVLLEVAGARSRAWGRRP